MRRMRSDAAPSGAARLVWPPPSSAARWRGRPRRAAEEPLSVTYGPRALDGRGRSRLPRDRSISRSRTRHRPPLPAGVRCRRGGAHDLALRRGLGHAVRYTAVRRARSRGAPVSRPGEPAGKARRETAELRAGAPAPIAGGRRWPDARSARTPALDDAWETLASVLPDQGDHVGDRYVFRLEVVGLTGDDGNPLRADAQPARPPQRRPDGPGDPRLRADGAHSRTTSRATEVAFDVPADADRHRRSTISTPPPARWRSPAPTARCRSPLPARTSGARARSSCCPRSAAPRPPDRRRRRSRSRTTSRLFVTDGAGRLLPMRLPARVACRTTGRCRWPTYTPLADCGAVAFDASRSTRSGR